MLCECNKKHTKWCPLKEQCNVYNPHEREYEEEFTCTDDKNKDHNVKCIKIK